MIIEEIITNGIDLAGGELIRKNLSRNLATLNCLNLIDTMMLELANSSKAIKGYKENIILAANTNSGTLPASQLVLQDFFICYRENTETEMQFLTVLDDIEDLKRAELDNKKAIVLVETTPRQYHLSFVPQTAITAEMWGKTIGQAVTDLNELPPFPQYFATLCAYRLADFTLNQLLAIDAKQWMPFVQAQKLSIANEKERLEHIWRVFRANPASANTYSQVEEYDWRKDYQNGDGDFYLFGR